MFADKVRLLRGEVESLADLPTKERVEHETRLSDAAMLPCALLSGKGDDLARMSPLAKQALLSAVGAGAMAFGKTKPEPILSAVTEVLSMAGDKAAAAAVRGSALATLAVIAQACGVRLVPHLPAAMAAVLTSGRAAAVRLSAAASKSSVVSIEPIEASGTSKKPTKAKGGVKHDDDNEASMSTEEAAAVELAAALAALTELIRSLGAFLSPYLKEALQLVLDPVVSASCPSAAAAVR